MQSTQNKTNVIGCRLSGVTLIVTALSLAACGEKPQQPPVPETAPVKLFQTEREALEKAKAVEQTAEKPTEDLRQQVEQQSE